MRQNKKFGVLSDEYIKNNYADCFLPIAVDKLHSVRQKPAESYVNTSGKRVKEYNSIAPVIAQFVAENNTKSQGIPGQMEANAIKSDLIRTAANAKSDYSILQPARKRQGALQQDLGFTKISSMANAQDPDYGGIDKDFIADELEEQAPLGAYGDKVDFNTMLGMEASRAKEDMAFAGKGVKPDLAEILDPSVKSKMYIAGELQRQPESALFAKRRGRPKKVKQDTTDLLPTDEITDQAKTMGSSYQEASLPPQASAPPPPVKRQALPVAPEAVKAQAIPVATGTEITLGNKNFIEEKGETLKYRDRDVAKKILKDTPEKVPGSSTSTDTNVIRKFLAENLQTSKHKTKEEMMKFLGNLGREKLKKIRVAYFSKSAGAPAGVTRSSGAGRPKKIIK